MAASLDSHMSAEEKGYGEQQGTVAAPPSNADRSFDLVSWESRVD